MVDTYDLTNPDKPTIRKDPDALLDYPLNLANWLAYVGDELRAPAPTTGCEGIATGGCTIPTVEVVPGYTTEDITQDDGTVIAKGTLIANATIILWIAGGNAGEKNMCTARFRTVGGRKDDRSIWVKIKER